MLRVQFEFVFITLDSGNSVQDGKIVETKTKLFALLFFFFISFKQLITERGSLKQLTHKYLYLSVFLSLNWSYFLNSLLKQEPKWIYLKINDKKLKLKLNKFNLKDTPMKMLENAIGFDYVENVSQLNGIVFFIYNKNFVNVMIQFINCADILDS